MTVSLKKDMRMTSQENYSRVARWLHWIIAVLVIAGLALGLLHERLEGVLPSAIPIHKSIGFTVLALTLVRLGWRLGHKPPPLPAEMPGWEKFLSRVTHIAFYALLLILPLSGWTFSSAGQYPLNWFGLFDIPKFGLAKEDPITGIAHETHELLAYLMLGLVLLHIFAALRHQFILKDNVLRRMTV